MRPAAAGWESGALAAVVGAARALAVIILRVGRLAVGQAAGAAAALLFDTAAVLGAEALDHIAAESGLHRRMAAVVFGRLDNGSRLAAVAVLRFGIVMAGGRAAAVRQRRQPAAKRRITGQCVSWFSLSF